MEHIGSHSLGEHPVTGQVTLKEAVRNECPACKAERAAHLDAIADNREAEYLADRAKDDTFLLWEFGADA